MNLEELVEILKHAQHELPGEQSHLDVIPVNRLLNSQIADTSNYRKSAVAIYLFGENSSVKTILIERPEYDGHHSKQISFPGGKAEPEDIDLVHTALREGFEEIGVKQSASRLILPMSQVHIPVSRFSIQPYLFHLERKPILFPDSREVARIVEFDIKRLLDDEILIKKDLGIGNGLIQKDIPGYLVDEDTFVWGATGMILSELKSLLRRYY